MPVVGRRTFILLEERAGERQDDLLGLLGQAIAFKEARYS